VAKALAWVGVAALFATLVPVLYLVRGVRRRQFTDHHVRLREQRPLAFLVGIASLLVGLALMVVLGAPRELVALVAAMGVGLIVSLLVTLFWKISVHVAVVAGAEVILVLVFGPLLLVLGPLVALVGWARVGMGDHTPGQVIAGSALGATVAAVVFMLLR
jgi:membrane-associated phospholipid phosphatase